MKNSRNIFQYVKYSYSLKLDVYRLGMHIMYISILLFCTVLFFLSLPFIKITQKQKNNLNDFTIW